MVQPQDDLHEKHQKPVIGLCGGVGAGKSAIAGYFGELGCLVLDSDAMGKEILNSEPLKAFLREQWGDVVINAEGDVDRQQLADLVFADAGERAKLEAEIHPRVARLRAERIVEAEQNPEVKAIVIDSALLFEKGLNEQCDVIVFVDTPLEERIERVKATRGWSAEELIRREKSQLPLDTKRDSSDYVVINSSGRAEARRMICDIFSLINPANNSESDLS